MPDVVGADMSSKRYRANATVCGQLPAFHLAPVT